MIADVLMSEYGALSLEGVRMMTFGDLAGLLQARRERIERDAPPANVIDTD